MPGAVPTSPGVHSRRDDCPPLSQNTYVCSLVVPASASASSAAAATLSRLDDPLPPCDRRFPNGGAAVLGPGEHGGHAARSCGGRRRRGSAWSGDSSTREPRFFDATDDVGGLEDVDSDASARLEVVGDPDVDRGRLLGTTAGGLGDATDADDDGSGFDDVGGRARVVGGLERSSSGWRTA